MIYLALEYTTGPETGQEDFVGPFDTRQDAWQHREVYGPVDAEIRETVNPPICMTPEEHRAYSRQRC